MDPFLTTADIAEICFRVKARKAGGHFFTSGDGMCRAMALVQAIEELGPGDCEMTVTEVSGRDVNEVRVFCGARESRSGRNVRPERGYLAEVLRVAEELCGRFDCEYEILPVPLF